MTRQLRQQSATGIHHVMLRGINRQTMFEDDDDYRKFVFILKDMVQPHDQLRRPLPPRCAIYSYCLMPNHVHLLILIRYIHQNPIAGGLCDDVESYEWSSWREFTGDKRRVSSICAVGAVLKKFPLEDLREQVNTPLSKALKVLEYDSRSGAVSDEEVRDFLSSNYGVNRAANLALYEKSRRNDILKAAKDFGASIRQLSRLTSLGYSIVQNA